MLERVLQTSHALRGFLPVLWNTAQHDGSRSCLRSWLQQIKHWLQGGKRHSAFWIRVSICICLWKMSKTHCCCLFLEFSFPSMSTNLAYEYSQFSKLLRLQNSQHPPWGTCPAIFSPVLSLALFCIFDFIRISITAPVATSATCSPVH